jgi:predicted site-specific integrase-resolvase
MSERRRHYDALAPDAPIPLTSAPEIMGVSRATLYRWIRNGYLPTAEVEGVTTVTPDHVTRAGAMVSRGRPR